MTQQCFWLATELQPKAIKGSYKLTQKHCLSAQQCVDLDVLAKSEVISQQLETADFHSPG
jgi:hypothetical protein